MTIFNRFYTLFFLSIYILLMNGTTASAQLQSKEISGKSKDQLENFQILVEKYQQENNIIQETNYLNKMAYLFWENGSTKEAVDYFARSVELNKQVGNQNAVQAIYTNIGLIYSDVSDFQTSLLYFQKSLLVNEKLGKKRNICSNYINIALVMGELSMFEDAIKNLKKGLALAQELNDLNLVKTCFGMLYENYEKVGNAEKSIEYFNYYSAIEKKMQQEKMSVMEQRTKTAEEKKQITEQILKQTEDTLNQVALLANEQQLTIDNFEQQKLIDELLQQKQKQKFRSIIYSFGIGLVLFIIIIVILMANAKHKQKTNALLGKQNKEILEQQEIIKTTNRNLTNSINYAKRIQKAMLPPISNFEAFMPESFILFKPRDIVSGDFFWFSDTNIDSVIDPVQSTADNGSYKLAEKVIVSAVDCTGHGVPGAFMSMIGNNLLHEIISSGIIEPHLILASLNIGIRNQLKQKETDNRDGMDMSVCVIDKKQNTIEFAGAKNPMYYFINDEYFEIKGDTMPIGGFYSKKMDHERKYNKHIIKIDKPVTCYIFSDGFADQIGGEHGKKYLSKRFKELLKNIHKEPLQRQKELLEEEFKTWIGDKFSQVDDILIIGFRVGPY